MPQLILCILPNTSASLYGDLKRQSETGVTDWNGKNIGHVITQCLQSRHIGNAKSQYCLNLALKMNVKIGGVNMRVKDLPFISMVPTLVMGGAVAHPSAMDKVLFYK